MKLGITDVYRLYKLGLLPKWMWNCWSLNHTGNAADESSFDGWDRARKVFLGLFLFSICLSLGLTGQSAKIFGIILPLTPFICYLFITVRFVLWASRVKRLCRIFNFKLQQNQFLIWTFEDFKSAAEKLLVSCASGVLHAQSMDPRWGEPQRKTFKRFHAIFLDFNLVEESWTKYFDMAKERAKALIRT